jgi:cytochrome oxidase Cu insertion factor (SCO1/SenC/PrrC family)
MRALSSQRPVAAHRARIWLTLLFLAALSANGSLSAAAGGTVATDLQSLPASWVDDRGQPFDLHSLDGRQVVLTMAYATCHRLCPLTMKRLQQLQREYDRHSQRVEFLVIGYDPDTDDAAAWHQYRLTRHLTRDNWHFLVGKRATVEEVARLLGFPFWKYDEHVMHELRVVFFDEHGVLAGSEQSPDTDRERRGSP